MAALVPIGLIIVLIVLGFLPFLVMAVAMGIAWVVFLAIQVRRDPR